MLVEILKRSMPFGGRLYSKPCFEVNDGFWRGRGFDHTVAFSVWLTTQFRLSSQEERSSEDEGKISWDFISHLYSSERA